MKKLQNIIKNWAISDGNPEPEFIETDGGNVSSYGFCVTGDHGDYKTFIDCNEETQIVQAFVYAPNLLPTNRLARIAELLTRLNRQIPNGHFDLDWTDGELRFRTSIDVEGGRLTKKMIANLFSAGGRRMNIHLPIILEAAHGCRSLEQLLSGDETQEVDSTDVSVQPAVPDWSWFIGSEPVLAWAKDIRKAFNDDMGWRIVGPAAIVEHDDCEEAALLFQRVSIEAGMRFLRVSADDVRTGGAELRARFASLAPALVFLESGPWLKSHSSISDDEEKKSLKKWQEDFYQGLMDFDPEHPVIFATCTKNLEKVSPILLKQMGFDRQFLLPSLPKEVLAARWLDMFDDGEIGATVFANAPKIGTILKDYYSSRQERELIALQMKRLAIRQGKAAEMNDLLSIVLRGVAESSSDVGCRTLTQRKATAIHEAGHAVAAILVSDGQNIPDYVSIVPGKDFAGIMLESVCYNDIGRNKSSYSEFQQKIRIVLAGRAAEELVLGPEEISAGSSSDLDGATRRCLDAFGLWGFAPNMELTGNTSRNLAVVVGEWIGMDYSRVYPMVQEFLQTEYREVLALLAKHRGLLDVIAETLMVDPLLDQDQMIRLCEEAGVLTTREEALAS